MKQITLSDMDYLNMVAFILMAKREYKEHAESCTVPMLKASYEEDVKDCESLLESIKTNTVDL